MLKMESKCEVEEVVNEKQKKPKKTKSRIIVLIAAVWTHM